MSKSTVALYLSASLMRRVDRWREATSRKEGADVSRSAAVARLLHRQLETEGFTDEDAPTDAGDGADRG